MKKYLILIAIAFCLYGIPRELLFGDAEPMAYGLMIMFVCGSAYGSIATVILNKD